MSLKVAVQMDHISSINILGDSAFALMLEAQARGHTLYHYTPDRLALRGDKVFAALEPVEVRDEKGNHFTLGAPERMDLSSIDVILMRQDPPFDMAYVAATHLLEKIHPHTLVVNNPAEVRNAPEKLFVTEFSDLMPPTLITRDRLPCTTPRPRSAATAATTTRTTTRMPSCCSACVVRWTCAWPAAPAAQRCHGPPHPQHQAPPGAQRSIAHAHVSISTAMLNTYW